MFDRSTRRVIAPLRALLLCAAAFAPVDGLAQSPYPINEQPAFGGIEKPPDMAAADRLFVEKAIARAGSREEATDQAVQFGWDYLIKGEIGTAMRRFNQAWLLDPEDARPYWGFAVVTHVRGDGLEESERWFTEALKRSQDAPQLYTDYGRVLEESGVPERAVLQFRKALDLDPEFMEAHIGMLRSHVRLRQAPEALRHAEALEKLGYPVPQSMLDELRKAQ